jgi:hypothetical protein
MHSVISQGRSSDRDLQAARPAAADRGGGGARQAPQAPPPRAAEARAHAGEPRPRARRRARGAHAAARRSSARPRRPSCTSGWSARSLRGALGARARGAARHSARARGLRDAERTVEQARRESARVGAELAAATSSCAGTPRVGGGARTRSSDVQRGAARAGYELALAAASAAGSDAALVKDVSAPSAARPRGGGRRQRAAGDAARAPSRRGAPRARPAPSALIELVCGDRRRCSSWPGGCSRRLGGRGPGGCPGASPASPSRARAACGLRLGRGAQAPSGGASAC